jgi:hypothetical protein
MRFERIRELHAAIPAVWRALHDPAAIGEMIPRCTRLERQPGHVPGSDQDFALGFEVGSTNVVTGAEPIIGWLEVDRQHHERQLALTLTLNDAVTFLYARGTITLAAREGGSTTEVHVAVDVNLPGMRDVTWSEESQAQTEAIIESGLAVLESIAAIPPKEEAVPVAAAAKERAQANGDSRGRVLVANERGRVVLLPAQEAVTPSQGMVRRLQMWQDRRRRRQIVSIAEWTVIGLAAGAVAAAVYLSRRREQPRP